MARHTHFQQLIRDLEALQGATRRFVRDLESVSANAHSPGRMLRSAEQVIWAVERRLLSEWGIK